MSLLWWRQSAKQFDQNHGQRLQNVHFRLTRVAQKHRCLNSLWLSGPHQEITIVLLWLLPAHVTSSFSKISDFIWKEKEHFWKVGFAVSPENNDLFLNKTGKCGLGLKQKGQSSLLEKPCYFGRKQNKSLCRTTVFLSPKLLINIISIINRNINN